MQGLWELYKLEAEVFRARKVGGFGCVFWCLLASRCRCLHLVPVLHLDLLCVVHWFVIIWFMLLSDCLLVLFLSSILVLVFSACLIVMFSASLARLILLLPASLPVCRCACLLVCWLACLSSLLSFLFTLLLCSSVFGLVCLILFLFYASFVVVRCGVEGRQQG